MLIDYINKNAEFVLVVEYCDEDLSGAGIYRPEFERLIKIVKMVKLILLYEKVNLGFQ